MSKHNPKITFASSAPLHNNLTAAMGFDGKHFFVEINGTVIAKRGLGEFVDGESTHIRTSSIGTG
jgi:hypothetical protein